MLTKGMPLTIRTLDIGGDKDIPYMGLRKKPILFRIPCNKILP